MSASPARSCSGLATSPTDGSDTAASRSSAGRGRSRSRGSPGTSTSCRTRPHDRLGAHADHVDDSWVFLGLPVLPEQDRLGAVGTRGSTQPSRTSGCAWHGLRPGKSPTSSVATTVIDERRPSGPGTRGPPATRLPRQRAPPRPGGGDDVVGVGKTGRDRSRQRPRRHVAGRGGRRVDGGGQAQAASAKATARQTSPAIDVAESVDVTSRQRYVRLPLRSRPRDGPANLVDEAGRTIDRVALVTAGLDMQSCPDDPQGRRCCGRVACRDGAVQRHIPGEPWSKQGASPIGTTVVICGTGGSSRKSIWAAALFVPTRTPSTVTEVSARPPPKAELHHQRGESDERE